jgi:hypothetical protein
MKRLACLLLGFLVLVGACGGGGTGAGAARIAAGSGSADAGIPDEPADDPACAGTEEGEQLVVKAGGSATARSGLTVRFTGTSHDYYDDGSSDLLLLLELLDGRNGAPISGWMPSAFAKPVYWMFGGFCVRVTEASAVQVVLDVAVVEDPARPLPPCHVSCCPLSPAALQNPADPGPTVRWSAAFAKGWSDPRPIAAHGVRESELNTPTEWTVFATEFDSETR